jgi:hypothetical protein
MPECTHLEVQRSAQTAQATVMHDGNAVAELIGLIHEAVNEASIEGINILHSI